MGLPSSCQGSMFFLVSFGSFLSSVSLLEEKWTPTSENSSLYLGFSSGPDTATSRPRPLVFRVCVGGGTLLFPPSQCVPASSSPCLSPHIRSHPFGKPSLVLQLHACVLPSCDSNNHVLNAPWSGPRPGCQGSQDTPPHCSVAVCPSTLGICLSPGGTLPGLV